MSRKVERNEDFKKNALVWRDLTPLFAILSSASFGCLTMDYRTRGSWIGNVRGRLGKAGYDGSDVACTLVYMSSVMRVSGPTVIS